MSHYHFADKICGVPGCTINHTEKRKNIQENVLKESKRQKNLASGSPKILANQSSDSDVDDKVNADSKPTPEDQVDEVKVDILQRSINAREQNLEDDSDTDSEDFEAPSESQVNEEIVSILQNSLNAREQNNTGRPTQDDEGLDDDDILFCLAVSDGLKKLPEDLRTATKTKIMEIMSREQNYH